MNAEVSGKVQPRQAAYKSKLEAAYALWLDSQLLRGTIREWAYEPESLRLGQGAWYKPDFRVVTTDGFVEMHETKGFWREAARLRIKSAAALHPYRFIAIQKDKQGWRVEEF
jgi:hypothetical protein